MQLLLWIRVLVVLALCVGRVSYATTTTTTTVDVAATRSAAAELARVYQLDGMKPVFVDHAADLLSQNLNDTLAPALAEELHTLATTPAQLALQLQADDVRKRIEAKLQTRIESALPGLARKLVYEKFLQQGLLADDPAIEPMVRDIAARAQEAINPQLDRLTQTYYDRFVDQLSPCIFPDRNPGACPLPAAVSITDLRGTVDRLISANELRDIIARPLAEQFGDATVETIQDRFETALSEQLPPEVIHELHRGPEAFANAVARVRPSLPGAQLTHWKSKLLDTTIMTLPNPVYGSILAGNAAEHFAKAFCGPGCFDAYELQRGKEVVGVLSWQLKNRDHIAITIGQLIDLAQYVGGKFGIPPVRAWGKLGASVARVHDQINRLEAKVHSVDAYFDKTTGKVSAQMKRAVDDVTHELTELQHTLLTPVREVVDRTKDGLDTFAGDIKGALPVRFNGIPPTWADMKKLFGVEHGWLGKFGDQSLLKIMGQEKLPAQIREHLHAANRRVSGWLARVGGGTVQRLGLLGPAAHILLHEKIPPEVARITNPFDPVLLHNGEFYHRSLDFALPMRGGVLRFERIYRSRHNFHDVLGHNWTHSFAERLLFPDDASGDVTWFGPDGIKGRFAVAGDRSPVSWNAPPGVNALLCSRKNDANSLCDGVWSNIDPSLIFALQHASGATTYFFADGRLALRVDAFGNRVTCLYNEAQQLVTITDPVGRAVTLTYDDFGRVQTVRDWGNRLWRYVYDERSDLIAVSSPAPDAASAAPTIQYRYQQQRLTDIIDPRGIRYLHNTYGTNGLAIDHVVEQTYGTQTQNIRAEYFVCCPPWLAGRTLAVTQVVVTDRMGHRTRTTYSRDGLLLSQARMSAPRAHWLVEETRRYDRAQRLRHMRRSDGSTRAFFYERGSDPRSALNIVSYRERGAHGSERNWSATYVAGRLWPTQRTDPLQHTTTYAYEGAALTRVEFADHATVQMTYDPHGSLLHAVDPAGIVTDFSYDAVGNRSASTHDATHAATAATIRWQYDALGNPIAMTDAEGFTTRWTLDFRNRPIHRESPVTGAAAQYYAYDANDNLTRVTIGDDPHTQSVTTMQYDALDHLIARTERVDAIHDRTTRYEFDPDERLHCLVDPLQHRTCYAYTASHRLTRVTTADGTPQARATHFRHDALGRVITHIDPQGARTQSRYDDFGAIAETIFPNGLSHRLHRNLLGVVIDEQWNGPDGKLLRAMQYHYNVRDRLIARDVAWWRRDPAQVQWLTEAWRYDARGSPVQYRDATGALWNMTYDGAGRMNTLTDPVSVTQRWQYDRRGALSVQSMEPPQSRTQFTYDGDGHLTTLTNANGAHTQYQYDDHGRLTRIIDPIGRVRDWTYDALSRVQSRTEYPDAAHPSVTTFSWDDADRLVALTDALQHTTRYTFDPHDALQTITLPDGATTTYNYDRAGRLAHTLDPTGTIIDYTYDAAGNVAAIDSQPANGVAAVTQHFSYDALQRLTEARDQTNDITHTAQFAYDSLSNPIFSAQDAWHLHQWFDAHGHVVRQRSVEGEQQFSYDGAGRLVTARSGDAQVQFTHTGWQTRTNSAFHHRVAQQRTFDAVGQIISERAFANDAPIWQQQYEYNAAGDLVTARENNASSVWHYQYDGADRLIAALPDQNSNAAWRWTLDPIGNWSQVTHGAQQTQYVVDVRNQLVSEQSDAAGRVLDNGAEKFSYDALGRLHTSATAAGEEIFSYDALNRRVQSGDVTWRFAGDTALVRARAGGAREQWLSGDGIDDLLSVQTMPASSGTTGASAWRSIIRDRAGDVRLVEAARDATFSRIDYTPYGQPLASGDATTVPFGFGARPHDAGTGLIDLRAREFDPRVGRFLSPDPLGYKTALRTRTAWTTDGSAHQGNDFVAAAPSSPFTPADFWRAPPTALPDPEMSLYLFARDNPLRYRDPFGEKITMTMSDATHLDINMTVDVYPSPLMPPNFPELFQTALQHWWNGEFADPRTEGAKPWQVRVTSEVHMLAENTYRDTSHHWIALSGPEGIDGDPTWRGETLPGFGGDGMKLNPNIFQNLAQNAAPAENTIAHEVGHWFGLEERYNIDNFAPNPGAENNIMGCRTPEHCAVNGNNFPDVQDAWKFYRKGYLNKGIETPPRIKNKGYKG